MGHLLAVLPIGVVVFPGSGISDNLADKASKLGVPLFDLPQEERRVSAVSPAPFGREQAGWTEQPQAPRRFRSHRGSGRSVSPLRQDHSR